MDPQTNLPTLVEDLEVNIDELTAVLTPLLSTPHSTTASTLPLLDKSKLYVLAAYAIESLLFSSLQVSGANAKEHAVFTELARLKGYFGKIKAVEEAGLDKDKEPKARLDKAAAARFIKHGLAGNERYDMERAERVAKEKARAALKARQMHIKFEEKEKEKEKEKQETSTPTQDSKKRAASPSSDSQNASDNNLDSENEAFYGAAHDTSAQKKPRLEASDFMYIDPTTSSSTKQPKKKNKKDKKKQKKTNNIIDDASTNANKSEETILPTRAPKTHSETFNSLLNGSFSSNQQEKGKGKGKGKAKGK